MAAKGFKIADGYLDIEADVDDALKGVRILLDETGRAVKAVEGEWKEGGKEAGKAFSDQLIDAVEAGAVKATRDANGRLRDSRGRFVAAGREIGDSVSKGIGDGLDRNRGGLLSRLFGLFSGGGGKGGKGGGGGMFSGIGDAFSGAFDKVKELGSTFQKLGSVLGVVGNILMALGLAVSIPLIISLVGVLAQLAAALFALPAAAGVAVAALLPLVLAFNGFGEAVSAAMSGDLNAFNEALKKLTPSAQAVAKEFRTLVPLFKQIQRSAQEGFFAPLVGQLTRLQPLLEVVRWGVGHVATKLGEMVSGLLAVAGSQKGLDTFGNIFQTAANIIDRMGPSLATLFSGILSVIQVALPWVQRFFDKVSEGASFLGKWLEKISGDGTLARWLEKAWSIGSDLWGLLKEVAGIVGALFGSGAAGDAGQGFIKDLTEAAKAYKEFLQSADGQEAIARAMDAVKALGAVIIWFATTIDDIQAGINGFFAVLNTIGGWFSTAWGWLKTAGAAIAGWFSTAWAAIVGFFTSAGTGISTWVTNVVNWFAALPGRIGAWLAALPGQVVSFFVMMFDQLTYLIGYRIGQVVFFFGSLPGRISEAWNSLVALVTGIMTSAWNAVVWLATDGVSRVGAWFRQLPGRISSAWSGLVSMVGNFFRNAWNSAVNATVSGFNSVMNWFRQLPGQIRSVFSGAGEWLYNVGRDVLRGLANGITSATGFVVDAAKRAANNVLKGFKDALGIGSPSKLMRDEVGKWIPPGIAEGIKGGMPHLARYTGTAAQQMGQAVNVAAPNVTTGPTYVVVDLGDGVRQVIRSEIRRSPAVVEAAARAGARVRAGWINPARA